MQQSVNHAERQKIGERSGICFLKNVWGCLPIQITERMKELGEFLKQDVKVRLGVMSRMCTADLRRLASNVQSTRQVSGREIMDVASASGGRLIGNF